MKETHMYLRSAFRTYPNIVHGLDWPYTNAIIDQVMSMRRDVTISAGETVLDTLSLHAYLSQVLVISDY